MKLKDCKTYSSLVYAIWDDPEEKLSELQKQIRKNKYKDDFIWEGSFNTVARQVINQMWACIRDTIWYKIDK